MKGLNIIALDKDYEIVSLLSYVNLQWNRKYFECGTFSIEIPMEQYDSRMKYVYTKDRPEMGMITQINFIANKNYKSVNISGYFLEHLLDGRHAYEKGTTNITNAPQWPSQSGNAEDVAFAFFNGFKDVNFGSISCAVGIDAGENLHRGNQSVHERDGEPLGKKIYTILNPSEMGYRVKYDFLTNKKIFTVWKGLDRTQDNPELNNPIIFSTRYGNIKNPNILIDNSTDKRGFYSIGSYQQDKVEYNDIQVNITADANTNDCVFGYFKSTIKRGDYSTDAEYQSALQVYGQQELLKYKQLINVEFDTLESSYQYMIDFDIGDKCSIEIPEVAISADAILIGCYEVVKKGINELTLEFGTPILKA